MRRSGMTRRVVREVLKAHVIVAVNAGGYMSTREICETLNRQLKTNLKGLHLVNGLTSRNVGRLVAELKKRGVLFRDPSGLWRISLPVLGDGPRVSEKRAELYFKGLSDPEIAKREGVNHTSIRMWRAVRNLKSNYPRGWRGANIARAGPRGESK